MTTPRLTDAQIATALRAHLPAHARSDVRERISMEVDRTGQRRPLPFALGRISDADPFARRRALLLVAAALLAMGAVLAATVGALLRDDGPIPRLTIDPAVDPNGFVVQAYAAHGRLPAMAFVADMFDDEGPTDRQRFWVDDSGTMRHECCDGHIEIVGPTGTGSRSEVGDGGFVWRIDPPDNTRPGYELAMYSAFHGPQCELGWRYVGEAVVIGRAAHHLACPRAPEGPVSLPDSELWVDADLGIALRTETAVIQVDDDGNPVAAYPSHMRAVSIELGPQPPELFQPPRDLRVVTAREHACLSDPGACDATPVPSAPPLPITTPAAAPAQPAAPDVPALVAEALASYADGPPMAATIEERGFLTGEYRRFHDGEGRFREEWHFDRQDPASPTVYLMGPDGTLESWFLDDGTIEWRKLGRTFEPTFDGFTLGLPAECPTGWAYLGLDLLLGREAWHISCAGVEYWVERERHLVVRRHIRPDPLEIEGDTSTVLDIVLGPQPAKLFVPPEGAVVTEGR
jgi:hypothetical protein